VVFIPVEELPDYAWRRANPGVEKVPDKIQAEGDDKRRTYIEFHRRERTGPAPRTI